MNEKEFNEILETMRAFGVSPRFIALAVAAFEWAKSGNVKKDIQILRGEEE